MVRAVVLDFGGVLAEEGFREGLEAIASKNGLDAENFFLLAREVIYKCGYVTGRADEHAFWEELRLKTGIKNGDNELRKEILDRFIMRPRMIAEIARIKASGFIVALLSDQTDWLDTLDQRNHFYRYFDRVFNSFVVGKSKEDPTLFDDVARELGVSPGEILFVDDTAEHIERARARGWKSVRYTSYQDFKNVLKEEHI